MKSREENGLFTKRTQLKKVPRLGAKTYEQAIGFLRVPDAANPFDSTGIHPESYALAEQLLEEAELKKDLSVKRNIGSFSMLDIKAYRKNGMLGK